MKGRQKNLEHLSTPALLHVPKEHCRKRGETLVDLQEESSETSETGNTGEAGNLGGTSGGRVLRGGGGLGLLRSLGGLRLLRGLRDLRLTTGGRSVGGVRRSGSAVGGRRRSVGGAVVLAVDLRGGDDGLGDGARAVGDGEGGGLSHGVGLVAVSDLGGLRAVGDVGLDDLGDNGDGLVLVAVGQSTGGRSQDSGSDGVLHLVGIKGVVNSKVWKY